MTILKLPDSSIHIQGKLNNRPLCQPAIDPTGTVQLDPRDVSVRDVCIECLCLYWQVGKSQ